MTHLSGDEIAEINDPATPLSLDPDRAWLRVACPNGHDNIVEDHEGGSVAACSACGVKFAYGEAAAPADTTPEAPGAAESATATDGMSVAKHDESEGAK